MPSCGATVEVDDGVRHLDLLDACVRHCRVPLALTHGRRRFWDGTCLCVRIPPDSITHHGMPRHGVKARARCTYGSEHSSSTFTRICITHTFQTSNNIAVELPRGSIVPARLRCTDERACPQGATARPPSAPAIVLVQELLEQLALLEAGERVGLHELRGDGRGGVSNVKARCLLESVAHTPGRSPWRRSKTSTDGCAARTGYAEHECNCPL